MTVSSKFINGMNKGFSLIEILISLLVLSGAIATMFSGFETSGQLDMYASFESEAAFLTEREIELVKAELLNGRIKPRPAALPCRFRLKPGWKISSAITDADETDVVRIQVSTRKGERLFQLESFVFVPGAGVKDEI